MKDREAVKHARSKTTAFAPNRHRTHQAMSVLFYFSSGQP
jgi:hypothetical protein